MFYCLYVGKYNANGTELYNIYDEEYMAENMGMQLKNDGYCDFFYIQKEVIIRDIIS